MKKQYFNIEKWSEKLETFAQKAYDEWKESAQKDKFKEKQHSGKKIRQVGKLPSESAK